jgi:hypothetical protein
MGRRRVKKVWMCRNAEYWVCLYGTFLTCLPAMVLWGDMMAFIGV